MKLNSPPPQGWGVANSIRFHPRMRLVPPQDEALKLPPPPHLPPKDEALLIVWQDEAKLPKDGALQPTSHFPSKHEAGDRLPG